MTKILLVDDDHELVDLLAFAMRRAGFTILRAFDAASGLRVFDSEQPDLAVLDLNLGAACGFELLRELRRRSQLPVIILTGRTSEDDKVLGLELGADDYLTKPFSHRELTARVRAHLRRAGQEDDPAPMPTGSVLQAGPIALNTAEHTATKAGKLLSLTVTEYRLLRFLLINAGNVVSTRAILKQVWGYDDPSGTDVVRVTVYRLRRKLEDDPNAPELLHTVPGVGILLKAAASLNALTSEEQFESDSHG